MGTVISALLGDLLPWLIGAGGALLAVVVAYFKGRSAGRLKIERDAARNALKDRERIDEAIEASRAGGGDWRARLRQHNGRQ